MCRGRGSHDLVFRQVAAAAERVARRPAGTLADAVAGALIAAEVARLTSGSDGDRS